MGKSNLEYVERFRAWLIGTGRTPADLRFKGVSASSGADTSSTEAFHREIFGPRSGPYRPD